jgi:hypothetical protein
LTTHDSLIVSPQDLALERDSRGSLVHVRVRSTGECLGCVEVGLFALLRQLILDEASSEAPR